MKILRVLENRFLIIFVFWHTVEFARNLLKTVEGCKQYVEKKISQNTLILYNI